MAIFISLIIVSYGAPNVFIAGSTQIRPDFVAQIQTNPLQFLGMRGTPADSATQVAIEEELMNSREDKKNLDYKPIMKGVYAAEDPATKEEFIKIDKGTMLEKRYISVDGREIMVYVPVE